MLSPEELAKKALCDPMGAIVPEENYDFIVGCIAAVIHEAVAAERERIMQAVSAERCPECRAGDTPEYDAHYQAWYHDRLLCLGTAARNAISSTS